MRVLLIAPGCDETDVGESWSTHQWARRLSARCDLTVITYRKRGKPKASDQLPDARVIEWLDWPIVGRFDRFNSMLKPGYIGFHRNAREWIRTAIAKGEQFDVVHQVSPLALRYACPAAGLGVPTIIGPVGGSLDSPEAFSAEFGAEPWYVKLRGLDRWRLKHSKKLRETYADASVVVGVAPYVRDILKSVGLTPKRFEVMSETGVLELLSPPAPRERKPGDLRLLFVGRIVRGKGVRDAVRAMAKLKDLSGVTLDIVGDGDDGAACESEAKELAVLDRVTFHGRRSREACDEFYKSADVFFFPSMREPSGNVVFEALSHGLPVIAADRGGPGHVVDDSCGIKVPVESPTQFAEGLADAVRHLAAESERVARLSDGARQRIESIALWDRKIDTLYSLYEDVAQGSADGGGS